MIEEPAEEPEKVPDLMAALEASIAASKGRRRSRRRRRLRLRQEEEDRGEEPSWPRRRVEVEVEGRRLSLSNLDKVMYPAVGLHQGPGDRLLHAHRARAAAAPARPPTDPEALPERRRGPVLLREALPRRTRPTGCGRRAGRQASTTASATTCRRSCGSPTWPTSSCTRRCRCRRRSTAPDRRWPSTSTRARRPASRSAARWRSCCGTRSPSSGSRASRRRRARRASRSTCR